MAKSKHKFNKLNLQTKCKIRNLNVSKVKIDDINDEKCPLGNLGRSYLQNGQETSFKMEVGRSRKTIGAIPRPRNDSTPSE